MSTILKGTAASPGIVIAKAYLLTTEIYVPKLSLVDDSEAEVKRFQKAVQEAVEEITLLHKKTEERLGALKAEIFESHLLILEDPELIDVIIEKIQDEKYNAEYALYEVSQEFIDALLGMDNELLRERASDLSDILRRIMNLLRGIKQDSLVELNEESIVLAHDLTPSDTSQLNEHVKGFVTEAGSRTSHSAIMARSLEIPAIVGAGNTLKEISSGTVVILDAEEGTVIVDPTEEELKSYELKKKMYNERKQQLLKLLHEPTLSKDGKQVELAANIGGTQDLANVIANGAEGIGLFRTEFLYMGRSSFPTEEEQFQVYKHVLEKMNGKPVVIRTLDIGGDKELSYMKLPDETNPFLGVRAIRLCLDKPDLFRTQLRALLRASYYGNLKIMFPMIAVLSELREAKKTLEEERAKLIEAEEIISDRIEVGIMVEIPAAALSADALAKEADFFSIGTNDLIQYTMAADRMNEKVSYLYQPYHPSILMLIRMVIQAGAKHGKWVGMCGEMAGDQTAIPILLGMGLHEFSMSASSVLPARELIAQISQAEWSQQIDHVLSLSSQEEVRDFVNDSLNTNKKRS